MYPPRLLAPLAFMVAATPVWAQPYTFTEIAREFAEGPALGFLDPEVTPALGSDGMVVFTGQIPGNFQGPPDRLIWGNGGSVSTLDLAPAGITDVKNVRVNAGGTIVFEGQRTAPAGIYRGIYRTTTAGAVISTVYEGLSSASPPDALPVSTSGNVALSENGTVAFSTITSGQGALYRGPIAGPVSSLRDGNGTFFNNRALDVNDAGSVAMEMEYTDPTRGLSRGVLVFSQPQQTLTQITSAVEKVGVGFQASLAINASGQVAFSTNSSATLTFYNPPDDSSGTVVATISLTPGVYVTTPSPFGTTPTLTQVASGSVYGFFGSVDINAAGVVVFYAAPLSGTGSGVFRGNDPVADKIVQQGDIQGGALFSIVAMGELNDAGQLSVYTSDFNSTDRQVWRIGGITPPAPPPPPPPPPPVSPLERLIRLILAILARIFGR